VLNNAANQWLQIERKTTVQTSSGNTQTWVLELECWGRVHPYRAKEILEAGSQRAEVTHVVWIRHSRAVVYGSHRVCADGQTFEIVEPPITVNGETRCYCREAR
jgi:SPP1 family predicted phage head-tail adaptor